MRRLKAFWLQLLTNIAALIPLALLIWDFSQGQLTADPIREITLRTGRAALTLLVLSLACTPVYLLSGIKWVLPLRRTIGLYAFLYAGLHFLTFIGLDYGFNFALIWEDIAGKYYVLVGLAALLILVPLAVTSTSGWRRRLGGKWERLHWMVYPAAMLAVAHFSLAIVLAARGDPRRPLLYGLVLALLLVIRLPAVRKTVTRLRRRFAGGERKRHSV
jgi:sulfoxide reductase heme-binding subunit YedZ